MKKLPEKLGVETVEEIKVPGWEIPIKGTKLSVGETLRCGDKFFSEFFKTWMNIPSNIIGFKIQTDKETFFVRPFRE